jgi:predicted RNase H-like HicB family nuclease
MEENKILIKIEQANDGSYSAYADNVEGIYGMGDTIEECKKSIIEAIKLILKYNDSFKLPKILKTNYEIEYELI